MPRFDIGKTTKHQYNNTPKLDERAKYSLKYNRTK